MSIFAAVADLLKSERYDDPWMLANRKRMGHHYREGMETADESLSVAAAERRERRENATRVMHGRHALPDTRLRRVANADDWLREHRRAN